VRPSAHRGYTRAMTDISAHAATAAGVRFRAATDPRPGKVVNEDLLAVIGNAAWLLDGASVPNGLPQCCSLDAAWYVRQLGAALTIGLAHASSATLVNILVDSIEAVTDRHREQCAQAGRGVGPSATVTMARWENDGLDFLVLGDSTTLLDLGNEVQAISDRRLKQVAAEIRSEIADLIRTGCGYKDRGVQALRRELVQAERAARNAEGGYWIASDDPSAAEHAIIGSRRIGEAAGSLRRIALLSDGVERGVSLFGLWPSWEKLLAAIDRDGPETCIEAIRAVETEDRQGWRFPRSSWSDDASAVLVSW
jgi:hypothetical protein